MSNHTANINNTILILLPWMKLHRSLCQSLFHINLFKKVHKFFYLTQLFAATQCISCSMCKYPNVFILKTFLSTLLSAGLLTYIVLRFSKMYPFLFCSVVSFFGGDFCCSPVCIHSHPPKFAVALWQIAYQDTNFQACHLQQWFFLLKVLAVGIQIE